MLNRALAVARPLLAIFASRTDLILENLALRQQLVVLRRKHPQPRLRTSDRVFWLALRRWWPRWKETLAIIQPETVIRWHREGFRRYWRWESRRRAGRPSTSADIRALVHRMAAENPTCGAPRIRGEVQKLGLEASERTVSRDIPRRPAYPDERQRWCTFLANHREVIAGMDFFTVPTVTFRPLYVFFVVHHARHVLVHFRDRGRDAGCSAPPAQIPACAADAPGSYLGSWRRSVVAASRTRSSVWDTSLHRLCVRAVVCCPAFPLVGSLPSTASADRI